MSELKNKEQIEAKAEEVLEIFNELKEKYPNFESFDFRIKNCSLEAMREIAEDRNRKLNFWDSINKMTLQYSSCYPSIYLYSPELEVKEHKVKDYAYKNI